ncbi:hypothetical protein F4802DRAFT_364717 [Xylaria palmicola]|nr:hypothetical protein F4802DRAFT_364717 [Xylaria palmicola]
MVYTTRTSVGHDALVSSICRSSDARSKGMGGPLAPPRVLTSYPRRFPHRESRFVKIVIYLTPAMMEDLFPEFQSLHDAKCTDARAFRKNNTDIQDEECRRELRRQEDECNRHRHHAPSEPSYRLLQILAPAGVVSSSPVVTTRAVIPVVIVMIPLTLLIPVVLVFIPLLAWL